MRANRLPRHRTAALYRLYRTLGGEAVLSLAARADVVGIKDSVTVVKLGLRKPRMRR